METITRTKIVDVLKSEAYGTTVNVKGWVRTRRDVYKRQMFFGRKKKECENSSSIHLLSSDIIFTFAPSLAW